MDGRLQESTWSSGFGRNYTDRNVFSPDELDLLYRERYGVTRSDLNRRFLASIPRDARILEVGANIGNQLAALKGLGFERLHGLELQRYAIAQARARSPDLHLVQGSAYSLPYREGSFDLVFTSGVLIHLPPQALPVAMGEIVRCSREYIWGLEYFAETHEEVRYRGQEGLLWKGDFAQLYCGLQAGTELLYEERLRQVGSGNTDAMYLLRKGRGAHGSQ